MSDVDTLCRIICCDCGTDTELYRAIVEGEQVDICNACAEKREGE